MAADFCARSYDYLVVGGGLAGLVLATRLSQNSSVTVGVIEAGGESLVPNVLVPGLAAKNLRNTTLDWMFYSTPQTYADGQSVYIPRGKGLGGSSLLNFMVLGRASVEDYNAFEVLGNDGWNWPEFLKYLTKAEKYTPLPLASTSAHHLDIHIDEDYHGHSGPLSKTLPRWFPLLHIPFFKSLKSLGVHFNPDTGRGHTIGATTCPVSIHPEDAIRSYSVTAYYEPNKHRNNLHVITHAQVTRVILAPFNEREVIATGVEFVKEGKFYTVLANKEVILSAGSLQTPQLLELSGIGNPKILSNHGIATMVDLPGVGTNLRKLDHPCAPVVAETDPYYEYMESPSNPEVAARNYSRYETEKMGIFSSTYTGFAFLPLRDITDKTTAQRLVREVERERAHCYDYGRSAQLDLHKEWLNNPSSAQISLSLASKFLVPPGKDMKSKSDASHLTLMATMLHPLSRGSVHIQSNDPLVPPTIDLALFTDPMDLDILVAGIKYARRVIATDPLRSAVIKEVYPGPEVQTEEALRAYARRFAGALFNPVGTAAMRPREHQGVVSPRLIVYGTRNLRVVDASVIPLQIGTQLQSTVYAIAEKAADIILQ